LIIENKALGYNIRYQLESFSYNFNTHLFFYQGYPFFQQMNGSFSKQKKWEKRRKEVYYGSLMHFMRSVYRNILLKEGFEVRTLKKVLNREKKRIKEIYAQRNAELQTADGNKAFIFPKDSTQYYDRILNQEDYF